MATTLQQRDNVGSILGGSKQEDQDAPDNHCEDQGVKTRVTGKDLFDDKPVLKKR